MTPGRRLLRDWCESIVLAPVSLLLYVAILAVELSEALYRWWSGEPTHDDGRW